MQGAAPGGPSAAANGATPFVLDPASLPIGPQSVGVSVQVIAPATMLLNKPSTVTILVKNTGPTDAHGVEVRDELPQGVKFVRSQPEGAFTPPGLLVWTLDTLPAGAERQLKVVVEPIGKGPMDHAATLRLATGSRAKSIVQQPMLRVEQTVNRSTVLKNQQVQFDITITNDGDGPATGVLVRADLSTGLNHDVGGQILEYELARDANKAALAPHESFRLPSLIVDATAPGTQSCTVRVTSPDVVTEKPTESVKTVEVTAPVLALELDGSKLRYTDTEGVYTLTVTNNGSAPAQEVRVAASLVGDGVPYPSAGGTWDKANRRFVWTVPLLEPTKSQRFEFKVRFGGPGTFQVNSEVVARGVSKEVKSCSTQIEGSALIDLTVSEALRVLDVDQETVFEIRVRNVGTKDARDIKITADLKPNLRAEETSGTDENAGANPDRTTVVFQTIDRLAPGNDMVLNIRAKATAPGLGFCRVHLSHQDLREGERLESVTSVTVPDTGRALK